MGCGEQGQLGRLSQRSASRDARQGFSALLTPAKVTLKLGASRVWAGCHATFVLDANGDKVFAFGLNNYGQLGITGEKRKTAIFSPTECDAFSSLNTTWSAIACGQHHSLAVDGNGQLYAIGRTDYGRLGLGERAQDAEVLEAVPKLQNKKCISIAAGIANSFAVTDTGEAFSWGMGSEGQLGTGAAADASEPTPPASATFDCRPPLAVSAGGQHTLLLLEETKELSPSPDNKAEMETQEEAEEETEEKVEKKRPTKRQKKQEQDEEISSTSTAQSAEAKPEKVNGGEQKENAMEVDETDKPDEKKETDEKTSEPEENKTEAEKPEANQPDTMDTSSQETTDSESKPMDTEADTQLDANTDRQADRQADRQTDKLDHIPTDNALTTSA